MRSFQSSAGIQGTLNRGIILPIIALVLVLAGLIAISNFQVANKQLETRTENLATSSALLFQDLLWQLDLETIQILLDEQVKLNAVTGASVADGDTVNLQAGQFSQAPSAFVVSRPLLRIDGGTKTEIGVLTMENTRESVWKLVRIRVTATLLIAIGTILVTTLLIQKLLNRTLIAPVLKISNGLRNWTDDWEDFSIELDRSQSDRANDELDELVSSIHQMRDHILFANENLAANQKRLARAAQIAGVGYSSFDLETGQYVACDDNFSSMVDNTVDEMLALNVIHDIILKRMHPDDVEAALKVGQMMQRGEVTEGLFRVARPSGEYRFIRQIFEVDPKCDNKRQLVHTVAQDVTEITRLQSTLLQAQKVKAIGNLTGGIAHDFNNLLAVISGNLELLIEDTKEPLSREYIQTSMEAVTRGATLTRQLLAFARKQPLSPVVLDPARLTNASEALIRASIGESIELEIVADGGLWKIEADKAQLEAVLLNLVINARDSMPDGGKLTIELGNTRLDRDYANRHEEVEPGQYVCIAVSDSGAGMSPETISRVLEPFFTTKELGKGTGLGLPMAFGFAKQSGGHLKVYSELGQGTTIKVYLPRASAPLADLPEDKLSISPPGFSGLIVLLIEDDDGLRKTYTAQLEKLGCIVHTASDAASAFERAKDVPHIDLILCDVVLPGGTNGPQVVAELSDTYPVAAVVYMSGYTENAIIHHGRLDAGVIMLQKPFGVSDLAVAFRRALDGN